MLLEVKGVTKRFGGLTAVKAVSFTINEGEIYGLIGPNGAGKTTLFNCVTGVYTPEEGQVLLQGQTITGLKPHAICARGIGRTFQITKPFPGLTVEETVIIGALNRTNDITVARAEATKVIEQLGLAHKRDSLGKSLTVVERKRLELARALATQPKLILLDEVVAGLNPTEVEVVIGLIRQINAGGVTILMIEHVLQAVLSLSHRMTVINYGEKIAEGTPQEIVENPKVIDAYLGEGRALA
jgi:branched-chain amino acid transport system ATP-binding protein